MKPTSPRAAYGVLFLLAGLAILCLLFPPVYAADFQEIPDGFRFIASLKGDDRVVTWLLWFELGSIAGLGAWLGMWMYQHRAVRPSTTSTVGWPVFAHRHARA